MIEPERAAAAPARAAIRGYDLGAILLRRWLATVLDFAVMAALFIGLVVSVDPQVNPAPLFAAIGLLLLYYPVCEAIWGRTLGKLALGLVVVDETGGRPGLWRVLVRSVFRLIEVNPLMLGGLPAALVVAYTETRQRLGDIVAGTYVLPVAELRRAPAVASVF